MKFVNINGPFIEKHLVLLEYLKAILKYNYIKKPLITKIKKWKQLSPPHLLRYKEKLIKHGKFIMKKSETESTERKFMKKTNSLPHNRPGANVYNLFTTIFTNPLTNPSACDIISTQSRERKS